MIRNPAQICRISYSLSRLSTCAPLYFTVHASTLVIVRLERKGGRGSRSDLSYDIAIDLPRRTKARIRPAVFARHIFARYFGKHRAARCRMFIFVLYNVLTRQRSRPDKFQLTDKSRNEPWSATLINRDNLRNLFIPSVSPASMTSYANTENPPHCTRRRSSS